MNSIHPTFQPLRSAPRFKDPFRFQEGDTAYVRGWVSHKQAVVLKAFWHRSAHGQWPHYIIRDRGGHRWTVSQLDLSSRPISIEGKLEGTRGLRFSPARAA